MLKPFPEEMPTPDAVVAVSGLTRREVLTILSGLMASSSGLGLLGCGSGGGTATTPDTPTGTGPDTTLSQLTGSVTLPAGSTLSVNTLSVQTMGQTILLASGSFGIGVSASTPSLAMLTDANGNGIMMGFLDLAGSVQPSITPHSTAVALTWFALGGSLLPAELKSQVLAQLDSHATMTTLGAVIAARIAANPLAVVNQDAQIAAALTAALDALTNGVATVSEPPAQLRQDDTPDVTVTPTTDQGGVSVRSDNVIVGLDFANRYQRPVKVYVYEVQFGTEGTLTDVVPAKLVAGPFSLGVPSAFTTPLGLTSLIGQPTPYKSFTLGPVALSLDGTSDETKYEVVVVGPSASGVVPAFFSAPRYASQVPRWLLDISLLYTQTFHIDNLLPTLLEMTGFGSVLRGSPNVATAAASANAVVPVPFTGAPAVPGSLAANAQALSDVLNVLATNPSKADQLRPIAGSVMSSSDAAALQKATSAKWSANVQTASAFVMKMASPFLNVRRNAPLSKVFNTLAHADCGVLWTASVALNKVRITPTAPSVAAGEQIALNLVLSSGLTSTYQYIWTQNSSVASFSAIGEDNTGASITTSQKNVNLVTDTTDNGPIAVHVAIYDTARGGHLLVASADASVEILPKATIAPFNPFLAPGDHQTFTVTVDKPLPTGLQYYWTLAGTAGSIGGGGLVITTVPSVAYTAVQEGTDTLSLQIVDANNKVRAKTSTPITITNDPSKITFTVAGSWNPNPYLIQEPPNGTYSYTGGFGNRWAQAGPGIDVVLLVYDPSADGEQFGVTLSMVFAPGTAPYSGQTFSTILGGTAPTPNHFRLTLDPDQSNPTNIVYGPDATSGTLTITSLKTLADSTIVIHYTLSVSNGIGGVIDATGVGRWKP